MLKLLKDIKRGSFARVTIPDKDGNVAMISLYYNNLRKKFYLSEDRRGVIRKSITGREAEELVLRTISFKELKNSI